MPESFTDSCWAGGGVFPSVGEVPKVSPIHVIPAASSKLHFRVGISKLESRRREKLNSVDRINKVGKILC